MARARDEDRYRKRAPVRRIVLISGDNTRTFTVRPWVAATVATLAAALSVAFLGATAYLVFRDDLIDTVLARNADLQQAYEDRIASLRAEIDKIASRQILDQVAYDEKVERLLSAQRSLGDRQRAVSELIEKARASGLIGGDDHADAGPTAPAALGYAPSAEAAAAAPFRGLEADPIVTGSAVPLTDSDGKVDVAAVGAEIAALDAAQARTVRTIAAAAEARAEEVIRVVGRLGVTLAVPAPTKAGASDALDAVGGPFVPLGSAEALASAMADASQAFDTLGKVRGAVARLPLVVPIEGADRTSNFGSRTDPFLGSVAFHAGIDFRSPSGEPVEATAPGRVVAAGPNGGYGNMVEIDHGRGLATRYAHLSKIDVDVGQEVRRGTVIGEVGSTGRSTGPHLHYETRVNGIAVNPETYLSAGDRIRAILR